MSKYLLANDRILDDSAYLSLGFVDIQQDLETREWLSGVGERARFDVPAALDVLKKDPDLGARLLSAAGDGTVLWTGSMAGARVDGRTAGVRVNRRRDGDTYDGDNVFGEFLGRVRDGYREYLRTAVIEEAPVREGQVTVDFTRRNAYRSDIEEREDEGETFIHVDQYRPSRFRRDVGLDGTTGHAQRRSDEEVRFHSFVCPFGTSYPAPVVVGSAAEASMLYERALRNELDWDALFSDLTQRGFLGKLTEKQKKTMAADYRAQFAWMREQIATDFRLRDRTIVSSGLMVPDSSFGRSQYDPVHAPSPAHVLARYVNNPVLLFTPSQNGVVRALSAPAKAEPERFRVGEGDGVFRMLVVGSDSVGGRIPGRKAVSKKVYVERTGRDGRKSVVEDRRWDIPMKSKQEQDGDYARFAARMDELLAAVPEGMRVELVTGNSSGFGNTVGVGTPRMVEKYVREKGGQVQGWDFTRGRYTVRKQDEVRDASLSCVMMEHFAECVPVMAGRDQAVTFNLDENDEESQVTFSADQGLGAVAAVCLSVQGDTNNRNVLSLGSFVADSGLPVVHVQEIRTEEEQRSALASGAVLALSELSGEVQLADSIFDEEERTQWELGAGVNNASFVDSETGIAVPVISNEYPAAVSVGGVSYNSVLGAFVALASVEYGEGSVDVLRKVKAAEGSTKELVDIWSGFVASHGELRPVAQEKLMRQSVRLLASANSGFGDYLLRLDGRDVVMPSSTGETTLFVDMQGGGRNRFGQVLSSERDRLVALREARRRQEEEDRRQLIEEANRRQSLDGGLHAKGEKVRGGFPEKADGKVDAVWFLGTNTPDQLVLPDGEHSFEPWNDEGGEEPLKRGVASADKLSDGTGGYVDNDFIFLFASDLEASLGRRHVKNYSDSFDLTGLTRIDRRTGEEFVCAYGIPVRFNNKGNEDFNDDGLPCSYRLDKDASRFVDSVVLTDSMARSEAIRRGMSLSILCRERQSSGELYYPLGQVFMAETWNAKEKKWGANPHRSQLNLETVERYLGMLERGRSYPLNYVPLALPEYRATDLPSRVESFNRQVEEARQKGMMKLPHFVSAEGRFLADLNMALKVANATAVSLGVPLRFPLDKDGRIDLGPGVPEEFRRIAERKIDSFIGVVNEEDVARGTLPALERIQLYEASRYASGMTKVGTDLYIRPNDLVYAFGQYDFSAIMAGQLASLHQMAFRTEDGTVFSLIDSKSTKGIDSVTLNHVLDYSKNDEHRFVIKSTDPSKTPEFLAALRAYVDRAKRVKVEARLIRDTEKAADGLSLEGFVNLLPSNTEDYVGADTVREVRLESAHFMDQVFRTEEALYTALLAKEFGKATPAMVKRIADIESSPKYGFAERHEKLAALRDGWADQVVTAALKKAQRKAGIEPDAQALAGMSFNEKVSAVRELDHGWSGDKDIAKVQKDMKYSAHSRLTRTVVEESHDIGREATIYNTSNRFDELDTSKVYWGKVDARDGFSGYAQIRYVLPDGKQGDWFTVKDMELAKDMVMTMVNRVYRTDSNVLPSATVLNMLMVSEAVKDAGPAFRAMDIEPVRKVELDSKVVEIDRTASAVEPAPEKSADGVGEHADDILEFKGGNRFLSNFWPAEVTYEGVAYPSVENAYQAAKCASPGDRVPFVTMTSAEAKAAGKRVVLRSDWNEVKDGVMRDLVRQKFEHPDLAAKLLATADARLFEGNNWGDRYWGVDLSTGTGDNRLGVILMDVREECRRRLGEGEVVDGGLEAGGGRFYVTYYGSRDVPEDAFRVQISTSCPKGMEMDVQLEAAYPDFRTMVGPHKEGKIDDAEYTRRYQEKVLGARKDDLLKYVGQIREMAGDKDVYFYCYCRPGAFCHRYLFNNFLNENGISCQENPADRALYRTGRVALYGEDGSVAPAEPTLFDAPGDSRNVAVTAFDGKWDRDYVQKHPEKLFVFTDNTDRDSGRNVVDRESAYYRKYGDGVHDLHYPGMTAAVIRGLDNAMPVSTQRWYHDGAKGESGRWTDADAEEFRKVVSGEFADLRKAVDSGRYSEVVFPGGDGLFNGQISAITKERTPELYGILEKEYDSFCAYAEGRSVAEAPAQAASQPVAVTFTESSGGYSKRTYENAGADDVDFTLAFAVDFSTYGEKATQKAAGESYIRTDLPLASDGSGLDMSDKAVSAAVKGIALSLPDEYLNGEPVGVNLAGNGLYTLAAHGVSQAQCNEFLSRVFAGLKEEGVNLTSLRSGGQTGVDESAAAVGASLGVPVHIHAPKGYQFRGQDGRDVSDEAKFKARFAPQRNEALKRKPGNGPTI